MSFDQICGLAFSAVDKKSLTRVVMHLSSAPTIQSQPLRVSDGQSPSMTFEVRESDVYRFKQALRSRGVVSVCALFGFFHNLDLVRRRVHRIYQSAKGVHDWNSIERVTLFRKYWRPR